MNAAISAPRPPTANPAAFGNAMQHVKTLIGLSPRRLSQDDVMDLIKTGRIQWAWDIGRAGAGRPEIRIWRDSLLDYLASEAGGVAVETPYSAVMETILPRVSTGVIYARQLADRFLCGKNHIGILIGDGELQCLHPPRAKIPSAILHQSARDFLEKRCLSL